MYYFKIPILIMALMITTTNIFSQTIILDPMYSDLSLEETERVASLLNVVETMPGTYEFKKSLINFSSDYARVLFTVEGNTVRVNFFTKETGDNSTGVALVFTKIGTLWKMSKRTQVFQSDVNLITNWVGKMPSSQKRLKIKFIKHQN